MRSNTNTRAYASIKRAANRSFFSLSLVARSMSFSSFWSLVEIRCSMASTISRISSCFAWSASLSNSRSLSFSLLSAASSLLGVELRDAWAGGRMLLGLGELRPATGDEDNPLNPIRGECGMVLVRWCPILPVVGGGWLSNEDW